MYLRLPVHTFTCDIVDISDYITINLDLSATEIATLQVCVHIIRHTSYMQHTVYLQQSNIY